MGVEEAWAVRGDGAGVARVPLAREWPGPLSYAPPSAAAAAGAGAAEGGGGAEEKKSEGWEEGEGARASGEGWEEGEVGGSDEGEEASGGGTAGGDTWGAAAAAAEPGSAAFFAALRLHFPTLEEAPEPRPPAPPAPPRSFAARGAGHLVIPSPADTRADAGAGGSRGPGEWCVARGCAVFARAGCLYSPNPNPNPNHPPPPFFLTPPPPPGAPTAMGCSALPRPPRPPVRRAPAALFAHAPHCPARAFPDP